MQPGTTEVDPESDEIEKKSTCTTPEDLYHIQPMEQEATVSDTSTTEGRSVAPSQPDSIEMESPTASHGMLSSEKDQSDGGCCSSSDSIPSLAAALMELHELLVSNNAQSQNGSTSCSPSFPPQDSDKMSPKSCTPTPENTHPACSTAITADAESSNAKVTYAATMSDEEPSQCLVSDLCGEDDHLDRGIAEQAEGQGPMQCPDGSWEKAADEPEQDKANNISISQLEPDVVHDPTEDLQFREPSEGQEERGASDEKTSGTNSQDTLQTEQTFCQLSVAVSSQEQVPNTPSSSAPPLTQDSQPSCPAPLPSPQPFTEQFPAEHIQRIQAAGFSVREAVEALEQAHGIVELALLALLARSITVPT